MKDMDVNGRAHILGMLVGVEGGIGGRDHKGFQENPLGVCPHLEAIAQTGVKGVLNTLL